MQSHPVKYDEMLELTNAVERLFPAAYFYSEFGPGGENTMLCFRNRDESFDKGNAICRIRYGLHGMKKQVPLAVVTITGE